MTGVTVRKYVVISACAAVACGGAAPPIVEPAPVSPSASPIASAVDPPSAAPSASTSSPLASADPAIVPPPSASASATPTDTSCANRCTGALTHDLATAIAARARESRRCYEAAVAVDSRVVATTKAQLRIGASGALCNAVAVAPTPAAPDVAACVAGSFGESSYPAPRGGCVDVTVPLRFAPASPSARPHIVVDRCEYGDPVCSLL